MNDAFSKLAGIADHPWSMEVGGGGEFSPSEAVKSVALEFPDQFKASGPAMHQMSDACQSAIAAGIHPVVLFALVSDMFAYVIASSGPNADPDAPTRIADMVADTLHHHFALTAQGRGEIG